MNSKQRKVLAAVFADPVSGTIAWDDIERLLIAVGCEIVEGSGSRVRFNHNGAIASFHRPHPAKEAKRYQVKEAREYLSRIGVKP
jgi:HicA toxin of bacterial toxin-antitoxin,